MRVNQNLSVKFMHYISPYPIKYLVFVDVKQLCSDGKLNVEPRSFYNY